MKGTTLKTKHLLLALLIAAVLVLAIAVPAFAAAQFSDTGSSPYKDAIQNLGAWKIVGGYADGTFKPDNTLQREQFAKMAVLTMGYAVTATDVSTFVDTPAAVAGDPLYPGSYVAVAAKNHLIEGYPADNTFRFFNNLTRQQAIAIVVRAAGTTLLEPPAGFTGFLSYTDPTFGADIKKAEFNGLLAGIDDLASWDVTQNATRGEAAQLLSALLARTGTPAAGASGAIKVSGLVEYPVSLTLARLQNMGPVTLTLTHPKNGAGSYTGVRFSAIFAALEVSSTAKQMVITASDAFSATINVSDVVASADAMIAIGSDGKLSTAIPGQAGKYWVKDVVSIQFK